MAGENPEAVYVKESNVAGSGLFASKDFGNGELIIRIEEPLITCADTPRLDDTCASCFRWTADSPVDSRGPESACGSTAELKTCGGCLALKFCNKTCQSKAWKRFHKYDCKLIKSSANAVPNVVRATWQLFKRRKVGLIPDSQWDSFWKLESHREGHQKDAKKWGDLCMMAQGIARFGGPEFEVQKTLDALLKILTNSLQLVTATFDPIGIALDPLAAMANHSCDPNAYVVMDGPSLSFRSFKPVKKDEEIFISYVDDTDFWHRREEQLTSKFLFSCTCHRCEHDKTHIEEGWIYPDKQLPKGLIKQANMVLDLDKTPYKNLDPKSDELLMLRLRALERTIQAGYGVAQRLSGRESLDELDSLLRACKSLGIFKPEFQPVVLIIHALFIEHLNHGNFIKALAYGLIENVISDPSTLPNPQHPVRVIHQYTLAMLCIHLAALQHELGIPLVNNTSTTFPNQVLPSQNAGLNATSSLSATGRALQAFLAETNLDLSALAASLLLEVTLRAPFSHGLENSFSKVVRHKASQVKCELQRVATAAGESGGDCAEDFTKMAWGEELTRRVDAMKPAMKKAVDWAWKEGMPDGMHRST